MGQRLAPVLAVCIMSKIEEPVLARRPLMYCRYIDDCCVITSTQSEMDECFEILNNQSQYISLTREKPLDGWLPYLNTQLMFENGAMHVKWYRKPSCKNIILHAQSAHPIAMKHAIIRNMYKTAIQVSSGENEQKESVRLATRIVADNGYPTRRRHRTTTVRTNVGQRGRNRVPLCLPFISDNVSNAIKRCIMQAQLEDVAVLVNIPKGNIKRQLVRNRLYDRACISRNCVVCPYRKIGDCAKSGVVFQIECLSCHAMYIGETGRPLSVRVNEHMASKRRRSLISPLGKHREDEHNGSDFDISCIILAVEHDISARKTLEASWILARSPTMNSRNEQLSVTSDLMPFLGLCEL